MKTDRPILGFGHQSRVGKDEATREIVRAINDGEIRTPGLTPIRASFAAALKRVAHDLYKHHGLMPGDEYEAGRPHEHERDIKIEGLGMTPVEVWIQVGNKLREVYPHTWLELVLREAAPDKLLVISDVRFQNEADAIRTMGGWCCKVIRAGAPVKGSDRMIDDAYEWDHVIDNDGTLEDLRAEARMVARRYLEWIS